MDEVKNVAKATISLLTLMVLVSKVVDHWWKVPERAGRGNRE